MQLAEARSILAEVLAPLPVDRFFDEIMGRSFVEVPGGAQHPRRAIFGDHPAETVLAAHATHADRLGCHAEAPRGPAPGAIPAADPQAFRASIGAFHDVGYTVRVPDVIPLAPGLAEVEVRDRVRRAREGGIRGVFLLPSRHSDEEAALDERFLAACRAESIRVAGRERSDHRDDRCGRVGRPLPATATR